MQYMKKKFKKLGAVMALAMGCVLFAGCSKSVNQKDMLDKYAKCCQLGEYKGIQYDKVETEITDATIDYQVNYLLSNYATYENATTGTAKIGDIVNIDFTGTVDGVAFDGGSTNGAGYELTLGAGKMIPGFEEQIVGHDAGETFDINVTFPEDYGKEDLAGQDAVFEITINSIQVSTLPEYNDEFIAANTDYETVQEYEDAVAESIKENDKSYNLSVIMETVVNNATIEKYPEKELKKYIDKTIETATEEAKSYGYDLGTYVVARYGMASEQAFRDYVAAVTEDFMKEKIVICAIAKAEGITASKDEISEYKKQMMDNLGLTEKELDKEYYDVRVIMPKYSCMKQDMKDKMEYVTHFYMDFHWRNVYVGILKAVYDGITFYFISP